MDQHKMNGGRNLTVKLIAVLSVLVGLIFINWHYSRCTTLCDRGFWDASPSVEDVATELNFFTDLSKSRATGFNLFPPQKASYTPLHWAVRNRDAEIVELLIEAGAPTNATADFTLTPLHFTGGRYSNPTITALLLEAGADPNIEAFTFYKTPLLTTTFFGDLETVSLLVAAGADLDKEGDRGWPALRYALTREDLSFARLLIESGANVRHRGLLYTAAKDGPPGAVNLLLEAGADPRLENIRRTSTGLHGFDSNGDLAALEALLEAGADINVQDSSGRTPLSRAMSNRNPAIIRHMIAAGAEMSNPEDWSKGLLSAASNGQPMPEIIELAIANGADPNYRDRRGRTALHLLADGNGTDAAAVLVAAGADIEALDRNVNTPFLRAIRARNVPMAEAFIKLGADIEATGTAGRGALHYVARRGGHDMLSWMLAKSTDVNPRDEDENTPLMLVPGWAGISMRLLLDAGADVNASNALGQTPLHFAASSGYIEGVGALVAAGANPRAIDTEGRAPRDLVTHRRIIADEVIMDMLDQ